MELYKMYESGVYLTYFLILGNDKLFFLPFIWFYFLPLHGRIRDCYYGKLVW